MQQQTARNTASRKQTLDIRNEKIRDEFRALWEKGYRAGYIYDKLKDVYFLDVNTLEAIVFKRGAYKE